MRRRFDPAPYKKIAASVRFPVRFSEVDALAVVWHGNYLHYFEEARDAFGRAQGLAYQDMHAAGFVAPVVEVQAFYHAPARFGDEVEVTAYFIWSDAAKLEIYYEVRRAAGRELLAEGRTVQVLTTLEGELLLTRPPLLQEFYARWERA
jgi:acyl-CoA thioester hydrolase